ncbi:Gpror40p [Homalodisca vitripennis]|nr:Gpror40p [Homalodisca vitripennis]
MGVLTEKETFDINPDSHMYLYLRFMQSWGLWPYRSSSSRSLTIAHWLYSKFMMVCLFIISTQQLLQMTISPDLENISAAIDVASLTLAALYRQILFTFYLNDFKLIADKIDANFQPHKLPYHVNFDIKKWLSRSRLYTYIYLFLPIVIIIAWVTSRNIDNIKINQELQKISSGSVDFGNLTIAEQMALNLSMQVVEEEVEINQARPNIKRRLPVNCWYPYDSGVSPAFEIAFVWETSMAAVCGMAYVISDAFLFMMMYLISGQLEILKRSLELLEEDYIQYKQTVAKNLVLKREAKGTLPPVTWNGYSREKEIESKMNEAIIKCIDFHNDILIIIQDLDLMLRSMIVVDFLHAVVSLSFAMLQTIVAVTMLRQCLAEDNAKTHQLNSSVLAMMLYHQTTVAEAAYNAPWVENSDTFKTAVYMIIVQARHPTQLSGWKMYVLGLSTFVEFMKLLASYFLVLQSLHAEEKTAKT